MSVMRKTAFVFSRLLLLGSVLTLSLSSTSLYAQINTTQIGNGYGAFSNPDSGMTITTFPEFPRPGEKMIVKVEGYSTDISLATITWFVDGTSVKSGPGERTITLTAPSVGGQTRIDVSVVDLKGRSYPASKVIRPGTVDLVWEADTYTPPFYQGKAVQTPGSRVRITAFANILDAKGNPIPPDNLVYSWRQGTKLLHTESGRGKQTITVKNETVVGPLAISVSVSPIDGVSGGSAKLNLQTAQPEILFYQNHPLLGILYEHALRANTTLVESEANVVAEPYFFSGTSKSGTTLSYSWLINGSPNKNLSDTGSTIVLRGNTEGAAAATIDLRVRHKEIYLQSARQVLTVTSGQSE